MTGAEAETDTTQSEVAAAEVPPAEQTAEEEAEPLAEDVAPQAAEADAAAGDIEPQAEEAKVETDALAEEIIEEPTNPHLKAIIDELPAEEEVTSIASEAADAAIAEPVAEKIADAIANEPAAETDNAASQDRSDKNAVAEEQPAGEDKAGQPAAAQDENAVIPDLEALEAAISAARREPAIPIAKGKPEDSNVPSLLDNFAEARSPEEPPEEQPEDQLQPAVLEALDDQTAETLFGDDALNDIGAEIAADRDAANMDQVKLSLDLAAVSQRTGHLPEKGDGAYDSITPESGDIESTQPRKIFGRFTSPESHPDDDDAAVEDKPPSLLSRYSKS